MIVGEDVDKTQWSGTVRVSVQSRSLARQDKNAKAAPNGKAPHDDGATGATPRRRRTTSRDNALHLYEQ